MDFPEFEELKASIDKVFYSEFKILAITCACRVIAAKRGLTLEQQMEFWIPPAWRELDDV